MVDAAPFAALRYDASVAGEPAFTSAPAYDDFERFTYARHRAASPYTVLELLAGDDAGEGAPYAAAGAAFRRWVRTGVLVEDETPAYYLYEIHELRGGVPRVLRGVVAAVAVSPGNLIPHEAVDPDRVAARARRMDAVPADLAPVFAVHTQAPPRMRAVIDGRPPGPPIIAFTDETGADHRVWAIRETQSIDAVREGLAAVQAVIADGHHRHAAAVLRAGSQPGRALTYLVDGAAYGPELRPVHRVVRPAPHDLVDRLRKHFTVEHVESAQMSTALARRTSASFGLYLAGRTPALVTAHDAAALMEQISPGRAPAWARLDAAVWEFAIRPLLGEVTVSYRTDIPPKEEPGRNTAVFVLRAPSLSDVFDCALAGEPLPAKSTWFRPKPRAGLVMRSLESDR